MRDEIQKGCLHDLMLEARKIFSLFEVIRNIWNRRVKIDAALAWLYYFNERHYCQRILTFSGELQQQEAHCQQPHAACQKTWRIDVPASFVHVRSRIERTVSVVNKSANVWKTNGHYNLQKGNV